MRGEPASFNNSLRKSRLYDIIMKRVDLVSINQKSSWQKRRLIFRKVF